MGLCWAMVHRGGMLSMAGGVCMLLAYAHVYMRTCASYVFFDHSTTVLCNMLCDNGLLVVERCFHRPPIDHRPTTECGGHAFVTSKGLFIPTLFTTFAAALLSYSRSEMKIKACFYFAFLSLNRTFALAINIESEYRR